MSEGPEVVIHTAPGCGWCRRARALLERHGIAYEEVAGRMDRDGRAHLEATTGGRTFPQVILDGKPIGGYQELRAMSRAGALGDPLPTEGFSLRTYLTPCNLLYGAIALATAIAVGARFV